MHLNEFSSLWPFLHMWSSAAPCLSPSLSSTLPLPFSTVGPTQGSLLPFIGLVKASSHWGCALSSKDHLLRIYIFYMINLDTCINIYAYVWKIFRKTSTMLVLVIYGFLSLGYFGQPPPLWAGSSSPGNLPGGAFPEAWRHFASGHEMICVFVYPSL